MKIYISGKITGLTKEEYVSNFLEAEKHLTGQGHEVANPVKFVEGIDLNDYPKLMGKSIEELLNCDAIYMLNNWQDSKGAKTELNTALIYEKAIIYESEAAPLF